MYALASSLLFNSNAAYVIITDALFQHPSVTAHRLGLRRNCFRRHPCLTQFLSMTTESQFSSKHLIFILTSLLIYLHMPSYPA